jgi:hypothetical protein
MATKIIAQSKRKTAAAAKPQDPCLLPNTISATDVGFSLPPLLSGLEPGLDVNGGKILRDVRVMSVRRDDINAALRAVEEKYPELEILAKVVRGYACSLDSTRDSAKVWAGIVRDHLNRGDTAKALESVVTLFGILGTWDEVHRFSIR